MIREIRAGNRVHLCDDLYASGKIDNNKFNITIFSNRQPAVKMVGAKNNDVAKKEIYKTLKDLAPDFIIGNLKPELPQGSILCDILLFPKGGNITDNMAF